MNSLSRTFEKLLSSPSTRNRVLLPLISTLDQSSSSYPFLIFSFRHYKKFPFRKSVTAKETPSSAAASVSEPIAEDHPRNGGAPSGDWLRPSEIPWQAKVCNSVNLIGKVCVPVQFQQSSDGKSMAATVITQEADDASRSPALW